MAVSSAEDSERHLGDDLWGKGQNKEKFIIWKLSPFLLVLK